jgi:hypothetical protein
MRLLTFYLVNLDWAFLFKIFGLKRQPPDGKAELILFFIVYILLAVGCCLRYSVLYLVSTVH